MKKMGLLELQQGQKFKKQVCWNSSKAKKTKNRASGNSASPKNQKVGRREIPEPEKSKSWPSENSAGPKNQKIGRREIPQGQKIKK